MTTNVPHIAAMVREAHPEISDNQLSGVRQVLYTVLRNVSSTLDNDPVTFGEIDIEEGTRGVIYLRVEASSKLYSAYVAARVGPRGGVSYPYASLRVGTSEGTFRK